MQTATKRIGPAQTLRRKIIFSTRIILLLSLFSLFIMPAPTPADTTVGGVISTDTTWTLAGSPYIVTSNIIIQGTDGITTLTIEPGTTVRFNPYTQLNVGASSGAPGALIAQGTATDPIIFTSNQTTPTPGNWRGIKFYATTDIDSTVLEHCTVEYAGYGNQGQVYIHTTAPTLNNCTFINSSNYDLYYYSTVGGTVSGCTLNSGIYLLATSTVDFTGNTFNQNNSYPIYTYADNVGALTFGNTFANLDENSHLKVQGGYVTRDATWTSGIPILINASTTIQGIDGITTLTIEPGATLRFGPYTQLSVGASSGNPGALIAQGSDTDPILFTSSQTTPAPGNWRGIKFYNTTDDATSQLRYCVVEYAGYGSQGLVYLNSAKPQISYSILRHSSHAGVYVYGAGCNDIEITCNTFSNNTYGVYCYNALPLIHQNNFNGNTSYGVYNSSSAAVNAEDNWWGNIAGPNTGGDATYGNVDAEPWSAADNQCGGSSENYPPFAPTTPAPEDNAVRVVADSGLVLSWTCSDPNANDTLTYDLYWGTIPDNLQLQAQGLNEATYTMPGLTRGATYYWQVTAKDAGGLSTAGAVWRFTTDGDPPDLTVSDLSSTPAGGITPNSWVTLTATITNNGSGPVVDSFFTEFSANSAVIGSVTTNDIMASGASIQVAHNWYYTGGDPSLEVATDSSDSVTETIESNNQLQTVLSAVADIIAPSLTSHSPDQGTEIQYIQQVNFTLADTQGDIDDAAVMASFSLVNATQQPMAGAISENNDTFTFVPGTLPLADGSYEVSVTAADNFGNSQVYSFSFVIDTVPPTKPVITGGVVSSGTIQPRPTANSTDRVIAVLEGTREGNTSLWVNGDLKESMGSQPWSCQIELNPGDNSFELMSQDCAGNTSISEWVDIHFTGQGGVVYEYDAAGRLKTIISK